MGLSNCRTAVLAHTMLYAVGFLCPPAHSLLEIQDMYGVGHACSVLSMDVCIITTRIVIVVAQKGFFLVEATKGHL